MSYELYAYVYPRLPQGGGAAGPGVQGPGYFRGPLK